MSLDNLKGGYYVVSLLRAVLLDLGDTLIHLDRPWDDVFQANLKAIYTFLTASGFRTDFPTFAETFIDVFNDASSKSNSYKIEIPMQDIIADALQKSGSEDLGVDLIHGAMIEFHRPEIDAWQLYPDTLETLTALRKDGYKMGLISNSKSDWAVHKILEKFDLKRFFNVIITSAELRIRKPRPDIFNKALTALEVKPPDTVFVGDSLEADIIGARNLGMKSIHICRGPVEQTNTGVSEADVSSLTEALAQITVWNNGSMRTVKK